MEIKIINLFLIFIIIVTVFGAGIILAQENENDSETRQKIIDAIISQEEDDDEDDEKDDDEIEVEIEDDEKDDDEIEVEIEDDEKDDDDEIEVEIEYEEGERKFKFKAKGDVTVAQIKEALQERNRLRFQEHLNGSELPENCTVTGSVVKCGVEEKLKTRVEVESNVDLSETLRDLILKLKMSLNETEEEIEIKIEVEVEREFQDEEDLDDESEIEVEVETEGSLTQEQIALIEEIQQEIVSLIESSDSEEIEIEIEIKHKYEERHFMIVFAGQSGNTIIQSKGTNASTSTKVQLYHHNGEIYGVFDGNETRLIDLLPDEIRERVRERIRAQIEGNETIELDEEGEYRVELRKRARFLGLFKVKERIRMEIDPTTGEVLSERAPWWGFLANDIEDEEEFISETNSTQ